MEGKDVPTSKDALRDPIVLKKEYMVIVRMKMNRKLMKNWDGVRCRFAMLVKLAGVRYNTKQRTSIRSARTA